MSTSTITIASDPATLEHVERYWASIKPHSAIYGFLCADITITHASRGVVRARVRTRVEYDAHARGVERARGEELLPDAESLGEAARALVRVHELVPERDVRRELGVHRELVVDVLERLRDRLARCEGGSALAVVAVPLRGQGGRGRGQGGVGNGGVGSRDSQGDSQGDS